MFLGDTNCPIIIPDNPIRNLVDIEKSIQKKFRLTLWAPFIKALKEFQLVQENDKIAVAISGGKDSLLLAKLFHELKRASNINFEVVFIASGRLTLTMATTSTDKISSISEKPLLFTTQSSYLSYQLHLIDCCYYLSCL